MIRLFGGILIFIVSAYCGFYFSGRLKNRRDFLRAMSDALAFTATEMEFSHHALEGIFRRADVSPALCGFFAMCADSIERNGVRSAWHNSVIECCEKASLKTEDRETLLQLGSQIGMSDIEGQKKAIKRTITHLDEYAKSADEEYTRLSKPYKSCGILLGVFVLIMII